MQSTIGKIIQAAIVVAILVLLLWISIYVLIIGLALAVGIALYVGIKKWLIEKGIIGGATTPYSSNNQSGSSGAPVIDADYKDVTDKKDSE